ncbi:MAG: glycoside hydrolase family 38 C-terminal domain-containing protein [Bacteroidota bacterium]|nr:glycoside hydrolase family 38 C-terminal domain-containing protein [Bacteroidota bacterium]
MRSIFFVILMILAAKFLTYSQTNVDKLVSTLDSLGTVSFNNWKVSPDLKQAITGDPTKPGYDDSKWGNIKLNQLIYPDSCWIRKEIILPDQILGQPVGGVVKFLVSVDDYGFLWINGESKGHFPWDGAFELTNDAKPGQKFLLAIKAINTGGPLRLLRAEFEMEATKPFSRMIGDFAISLRVGQKLLSFDTYQTNARRKQDPGIDNSKMDREEKIRLNNLLQNSVTEVDVSALKSGSLDKFSTSIDKVRTQLKPVSEFAKRYTLFFDANAHIDAAWLWRERETIEVCKNTFTSVLNMMDSRPDFTYTQSSAAYYDWMEKLYPGVFKRIVPRVKDGRWELIGGMWIEPDCNLPSGESWMRQLLYAKRYFKEKFGVDVKIGWNPDSFGYNWNMPQFYVNAGIDAFVTQKIGWNETNVFPHRAFWWESPDGSRILSYFPFDYVNTVDDPYRLVDWARQFDANTGFTKMMILFGVGDHGGGPSDDMIDRIEHLKTLDIYPTIEYGTTAQYLDWLKRQDLSSLPVWKDELYLEYHQGTFTTQAKTKEWNRKSEVLLTNVEKFSSLSSMFGGNYNSNNIEEAWKNVLFNQFHDILPGSSIHEVYVDAPERYEQAGAIGLYELKKALIYLSNQINTAIIKKGEPIIVFNPLPWERTNIATLQLPEADYNDYSIFDVSGKEIPSQIIQKDRYHRDIIFTAENIPSLGYKLFELRKQKSAAVSKNFSAAQALLENEFFTVILDPATGWVTSIVDKRNGREILSGLGNELQMLEDKPSAWDAWNIGLTGKQFPTSLRKIEVIENGPVRATLRITRDYLKPGVKKEAPTQDYPSTFFTQEISLYDGIDYIDFKTDVDWWEEKTMLKVAFPISVKNTFATYEIPYGTIQRSTQWRDSWDSAKVEVPALRWADLSQHDYGVSLLNNSKYGYDIKDNIIRLSLLRSPKWPDPMADRGKHSISYALFPHADQWHQAKTVYRGYEYNYPLLAFRSNKHKGKLPAKHSFSQLQPSNLILTTIKKAEDTDAWIFQWYDAKGEETEAILTLPKSPKKAALSNFMEEEKEVLQITGNIIKAPTKKHGVATVKVWF